jgi:hypothetical protein
VGPALLDAPALGRAVSCTRSILVVLAWFLLPGHRFTVIPAMIVIVYLVSIAVQEIVRAQDQRSSSIEV